MSSCSGIHISWCHYQLPRQCTFTWYVIYVWISRLILVIYYAPPWSSWQRVGPPEFKPQCGHIWRVFHLWLCFITFEGRSAHLAYHVHKSGSKTPIPWVKRKRATFMRTVFVGPNEVQLIMCEDSVTPHLLDCPGCRTLLRDSPASETVGTKARLAYSWCFKPSWVSPYHWQLCQ